MKKIYKYTLDDACCDIALPLGAKILCVEAQYNTPRIWVLVDPDVEEVEIKSFRYYGTGQRLLENNGVYIGTFQLNGGLYVFHLFEHTIED